MKEKFVISNVETDKILAIVDNEALAVYFTEFLSFKCDVVPLSFYDFSRDKINAFLA